jgi:hypothetical protein
MAEMLLLLGSVVEVTRDTAPAGVPVPVTVAVAVTFAPWVRVVGERVRVVVLGLKVIFAQLVIIWLTSTVPRPEARS